MECKCDRPAEYRDDDGQRHCAKCGHAINPPPVTMPSRRKAPPARTGPRTVVVIEL